PRSGEGEQPSFPSSAWERTASKLCFESGLRRETSRSDCSSLRRSRASGPGVPKQSLGTRILCSPSPLRRGGRGQGFGRLSPVGRSIIMPRSLRPSLLLLALFFAVLCRPLEAQRAPRRPPAEPPKPGQAETDPSDLGGLKLTVEKNPFTSHLDAARRAINDKDWPV